MDSMKLAAYCSIFFFITSSVFSTWPVLPMETGCAAPMVVWGAIAAMSAAIVMNTPALPALAWVGET